MLLMAADFARPATELASWLLGKWLCRRLPDGSVLRRRITETECYFGEEDTACHAHKGRTPRTDALYQQGGITYVYLCYGIHSLLNLVTGMEGHPEAVLIRGVEGYAGPGRVTKGMGITCADNRLPLTEEGGIWVEDDGTPPPAYTALPRVGIDYAKKEDRERPWRYLVLTEKRETV
ncbi:MAG: DNA-3-methyladenine glycosylase [Ruminococcaceae bacterium]|nr:DNA-3-methyladenine glycosylase [Oscillospiraceae bacterium]